MHRRVRRGLFVALLALGGCDSAPPTPAEAIPEPRPAAQRTQGQAPAQAPQPTPQPTPPARNDRPASAKDEGWNDAQIGWLSYEQGLAKAKAENKPICMVFYTHWCPHCRNYSHVFEDPKVVEQARHFVMIRVNPDDEPAIGEKFSPDGGYVPRTFFLSPDGTLLADVHAPRPKFLYFFDEHEPASLLGGMQAALQKRVR